MKYSPYSRVSKKRNNLSDIQAKVIKHIDQTWAKKSGRNAEETAKALLSYKRARWQIGIIKKYTSLKNKKLLEIGSGYSTFLSIARSEFNINAIGIEPAKWGLYDNAYQVGKEVLSLRGISRKCLMRGSGEKIPLPDNSFDIVYSHYVLEHTNNEAKIIKEALRVLKRGGFLIFIFPNYNSFWEGHYGIFWLPFLNKRLARIYVRLAGRDPSIINELNFVTRTKIKKLLDKIPQLEVLTWGKELFEESIKKLNFPDDGTLKSAKKILKIMKTLKIAQISIFFAKIFHLYTPILLVARKNN